MNKWLKLKDGTFYFGHGGITRIEPIGQYEAQKTKEYNTRLYEGIKSIAVVQETVEELSKLLEAIEICEYIFEPFPPPNTIIKL